MTMRRLLLILALCPRWTTAQTALTTVSDVITYSDGSHPSGTAVISWSRYLNDANPRQTIYPGSIPITITNGVVNVSLFPNAVALPPAGCYVVSYSLASVSSIKYWFIPVSSTPVNLNRVEGDIPCSTQQGAQVAPAQMVPGAPGVVQVLTSNANGSVNWALNSSTVVPGGTPGQIQWNNTGTFGGFTVSGDGTLNTSTGVLTVTKTSGVAFAASATTDTTNAGNISSGTLAAARLPAINLAASGAGGVTGNLPVANLNSGTGATSSTYWTGNGTWTALPAINLAASGSGGVTGNLPVGNLAGGSGASSSTFWRGDGTWASAGTVTHTAGGLTANAIVLGNGSADITVLGSLGTTTTLLHGNASGAPSFSVVSLTADVSGTLPFANGGLGTNTNFANHTFYGNNSGGTAAPVATQPTFADLATGQVSVNAKFLGGALFIAGINPQSSTSYTMTTTDANKLVTFNNGSPVAVTLPQATTTGFTEGAFFPVFNLGVGAVTITPTTSMINGGSTLVVNQNRGALIVSDGTNYSAWLDTMSVATTSPITGGTITSSGTIACPTCVTSAASLTNKGVMIGQGSQASATIDFPHVVFSPAATCTNATPTALWSIGSGGTVTCRAGTNNLGAFIAITDTAGTFAQFPVTIPEDWDSSANPYIRVQVASTDTNNTHTIIPQIQTSCQKGDGSTTDDVTFNAAHSLSTITLNSTANQFWSTSNVQLNSTDMTGCVAGSLMIVRIGRASDTSTSGEFYSATMTFPRLITVQAN